MPPVEELQKAIAEALAGWLDPDDPEDEDLAQILSAVTEPAAKAFASYEANQRAWDKRASARDEERDLKAILKQATDLRENMDQQRTIHFMEWMEHFPPFAFPLLHDRHGDDFFHAANRLREQVSVQDLDTLIAALSDLPELPRFTKRSQHARLKLERDLIELYRHRIWPIRLQVWEFYLRPSENDPPPPSAHKQFAESVMRQMGVKYESKHPS